MESFNSFYDVTYYDGHSARGRPAHVSFNAYDWSIRFHDDGGALVTIRWDVSCIVRNETASGVNTFRLNVDPPEVIESRDPRVLQALKANYPHHDFAKRKSAWLPTAGLAGIVALVTLFMAFLAAAYFVLLPAAAGMLANTVPQEYEVKLGDQLYEGFMAGYTVNDTLTKHVNGYASRIDFATGYPIRITVVEQDELNAFALPGGRIVVFSKLLRKMDRHEELAALLGHEAAHVKERHSLKALARNVSGYLFISLLLGDLSAAGAILVDNADMLNRMRYSRSLERSADEDAVRTLNRNGIDISGMVKLFETLESESSVAVPEFIASHPLTKDRKRFAADEAAKQNALSPRLDLESAWTKIKR